MSSAPARPGRLAGTHPLHKNAARRGYDAAERINGDQAPPRRRHERPAARRPGHRCLRAGPRRGQEHKAEILIKVAQELAASDPERTARVLTDAERAARAIPEGFYTDVRRTRALAKVTKAFAASDPERAARILTDAERIAQSTDERNKAKALGAVVEALAATNPDSAAST